MPIERGTVEPERLAAIPLFAQLRPRSGRGWPSLRRKSWCRPARQSTPSGTSRTSSSSSMKDGQRLCGTVDGSQSWVRETLRRDRPARHRPPDSLGRRGLAHAVDRRIRPILQDHGARVAHVRGVGSGGARGAIPAGLALDRRDSPVAERRSHEDLPGVEAVEPRDVAAHHTGVRENRVDICLLYTSDAADE